MSGSQKALKVISILMIIWAVVQALVGVLFIAGAQMPGMSNEVVDVDSTSMNLASASLVLGIGFIVAAVVNLIIAILGLRGAKDSSKIGAYLVLCIIGLVLGLISLGMSIAQGDLSAASLVDLVIIVVCTVLAFNIKKQPKEPRA